MGLPDNPYFADDKKGYEKPSLRYKQLAFTKQILKNLPIIRVLYFSYKFWLG